MNHIDTFVTVQAFEKHCTWKLWDVKSSNVTIPLCNELFSFWRSSFHFLTWDSRVRKQSVSRTNSFGDTLTESPP